jgi:hypothetical protein
MLRFPRADEARQRGEALLAVAILCTEKSRSRRIGGASIRRKRLGEMIHENDAKHSRLGRLRRLTVVAIIVCGAIGVLWGARRLVREVSELVGGDCDIDNEGNLVTVWQKQSAMRALRRLGAEVRQENEGVVSVTLTSVQVTDNDLVHLRAFPRLREVDLVDTAVTDAGLVHLAGLTHLQCLRILNAPITGTGLKHLEGLTKLRYLELFGCRVSNVGLDSIGKLKSLERLELTRTELDDAGLKSLGTLQFLRTLDLAGTQITDAGLACLEGFPSLGQLILNGTQVSDSGFQSLERVPNLWCVLVGDTRVTEHGISNFRRVRPDVDVGVRLGAGPLPDSEE